MVNIDIRVCCLKNKTQEALAELHKRTYFSSASIFMVRINML